jgi:hypothetical protein
MNRLLYSLAAFAVVLLTRSTSAQVSHPINGECPPETYKNSDGNCVERRTIPHDEGATAICEDGEYSYSQHRTGNVLSSRRCQAMAAAIAGQWQIGPRNCV